MTIPLRVVPLIILVAVGVGPLQAVLDAQVIGMPQSDRHRLAGIAPGVTAVEDSGRSPPTWRGLHAVAPVAALVYNSALPHSLNDGPLWAGRGLNLGVSAGAGLSHRFGGAVVSAQLVPTVTWAQNRPFQIYPYHTDERSPFASPLFPAGVSADLPLRFGSLPLTVLHPGESHVTVSGRSLAGGFSTQQQWWGPGIRNALVISSNAPGIPHLFLRTARPLVSAIGAFEARLIAGTLTESIFFDTISTNDHRAVSGLVVTFRPRAEPNLMLGISRVVYRPSGGPGEALGHAADVLTTWESPRGTLESDLATGAPPDSDQLISLFWQWTLPDGGFEAYGEWARAEIPRSMAEYLAAPHHTQGYTLGFQLAGPARRRGHLIRLQGEITNLEQSTVFPDRPPPEFYTGRSSPQGFTNRGQVVGAAIGPGSSSQWLAVDYFTRSRSAGVFVGRIRWHTDAFYRQVDPRPARRDVTALAGLRGSGGFWRTHGESEITLARRFNYLYQNEGYLGDAVDPVDIFNLTLSVKLRPR
jgi:hypothetical protein